MSRDWRLIEGETGCQEISLCGTRVGQVWGVCGTQLLTTALGTAVSAVSGRWLRGI